MIRTFRFIAFAAVAAAALPARAAIPRQVCDTPSFTIVLQGALDDLYAAAQDIPDLGATPRTGGTGFALWAPTAQQAAVLRL